MSPRHHMRRPFSPATAAELDQAAEITPADIAHAREAWRGQALGKLRDVLDATAIEIRPEPKS